MTASVAELSVSGVKTIRAESRGRRWPSLVLAVALVACSRTEVDLPPVDAPLVLGERTVAPHVVREYLELRTGLQGSTDRCAWRPIARRDDVVLLHTLCARYFRDADTLVADPERRAVAMAVRLAVVGDTARIMSHALVDSAGSDSLVRAFTADDVARARTAARDTAMMRPLLERIRTGAEEDFGLRPDPRDTLPVHAAADWTTHRDTVAGIELRAPAGWLPDDWRVEACGPTTQPTDSSLQGKTGEGVPGGGPLEAAMRRGTTAAALEANGFMIGPWGVDVGGRHMSGGSSVRHGGGRWITMSGDYWFAHYEPEGGLAGQESTNVMVGIVDVGGGCRLVFAAGGEELPSLDTLAAVLETVRPVGRGLTVAR